jgi:L-asparaginase/Glu-tRNA(Gln) amidotransferase subunit D
MEAINVNLFKGENHKGAPRKKEYKVYPGVEENTVHRQGVQVGVGGVVIQAVGKGKNVYPAQVIRVPRSLS